MDRRYLEPPKEVLKKNPQKCTGDINIVFLTVDEFAERIRMHPNSVRKSIREGKIFATRPSTGKRSPYRIAESELERLYLQSMCEEKK